MGNLLFGLFGFRRGCFCDLAKGALERLFALVCAELPSGFYEALVLRFGLAGVWFALLHGGLRMTFYVGDLLMHGEVRHV